jgi:hypothetical protein
MPVFERGSAKNLQRYSLSEVVVAPGLKISERSSRAAFFIQG